MPTQVQNKNPIDFEIPIALIDKTLNNENTIQLQQARYQPNAAVVEEKTPLREEEGSVQTLNAFLELQEVDRFLRNAVQQVGNAMAEYTVEKMRL